MLKGSRGTDFDPYAEEHSVIKCAYCGEYIYTNEEAAVTTEGIFHKEDCWCDYCYDAFEVEYTEGHELLEDY